MNFAIGFYYKYLSTSTEIFFSKKENGSDEIHISLLTNLKSPTAVKRSPDSRKSAIANGSST